MPGLLFCLIPGLGHERYGQCRHVPQVLPAMAEPSPTTAFGSCQHHKNWSNKNKSHPTLTILAKCKSLRLPQSQGYHHGGWYTVSFSRRIKPGHNCPPLQSRFPHHVWLTAVVPTAPSPHGGTQGTHNSHRSPADILSPQAREYDGQPTAEGRAMVPARPRPDWCHEGDHCCLVITEAAPGATANPHVVFSVLKCIYPWASREAGVRHGPSRGQTGTTKSLSPLLGQPQKRQQRRERFLWIPLKSKSHGTSWTQIIELHDDATKCTYLNIPKYMLIASLEIKPGYESFSLSQAHTLNTGCPNRHIV